MAKYQLPTEAVQGPRAATGAEIAALMAYCPTFGANDAKCCAHQDEPELCAYHQGWVEAWEQAHDRQGILPASELDRLIREGLLR